MNKSELTGTITESGDAKGPHYYKINQDKCQQMVDNDAFFEDRLDRIKGTQDF